MKNNPNSYAVSIAIYDWDLSNKIKSIMRDKYWYCYDFDKLYDPRRRLGSRREKPKAWYNPNWFWEDRTLDYKCRSNRNRTLDQERKYDILHLANKQDLTEIILMAKKPFEELGFKL